MAWRRREIVTIVRKYWLDASFKDAVGLFFFFWVWVECGICRNGCGISTAYNDNAMYWIIVSQFSCQ